jgi:hypothetical protein
MEGKIKEELFFSISPCFPFLLKNNLLIIFLRVLRGKKLF